MKYLKHSLLLLVLSGFLTGEIAAIESSLPPCPTKKGFFSGVSKWKHCYGSIEGGGYKYVGGLNGLDWLTADSRAQILIQYVPASI